MNKFLAIACAALAVLTTAPLAAHTAERATHDPLTAISGIWYTQKHEGGIQLYPCDGKICGRFYWLKDDSPARVARDRHNPAPAMRRRPLCLMQFMGNFTPDGHGHYTGGWIYNPEDGNTYDAQMTLANRNTLKLHGYLLLPALGQDRTWHRAHKIRRCTTAGD
ncbi:MAG TPA: DUF2147 domain-containing protein [Alphaproteobacteria bacterium]|nr:DUF2147 domain-containing protein [Alphaproteobacteria bacterium]